jgi:hypothetical protein
MKAGHIQSLIKGNKNINDSAWILEIFQLANLAGTILKSQISILSKTIAENN